MAKTELCDILSCRQRLPCKAVITSFLKSNKNAVIRTSNLKMHCGATIPIQRYTRTLLALLASISPCPFKKIPPASASWEGLRWFLHIYFAP